LDEKWKKELPAALLAGAICGIITFAALMFLAPQDWYLALVVFAVMTGFALWKSVSDKDKSAKKYKRDERLIVQSWFLAEEGFIRTDSDRAAKFFFGEEGISVLYYKNVKPIIEFVTKEKITGTGTDRCGWISLIVPEEKRRFVFEKESAERIKPHMEKIISKKEALAE